MTAVGKALAIFIFAVSICYLSLSLLLWQVQFPNWESKIPILKEYKIVSQPGDKVIWIGTNAVTKAQVSSDAVLAKVLLTCFEDANKKMKAEITKNTTDFTNATQELVKLKESIKLDSEAVEKRRQLSVLKLNEIQTQKEKLTADAAIEVDKAQKIQEEAEKLREDIFRLAQQLDELKTERKRVKDIQVQLKDLIIRTEGLNLRLLERNQQLKGG